MKGDLTDNFSRWEFACKCGCGFDQIEMNLVEQIQRFRDLLWIATGKEIPLTISSGIRCEAYNEKIGGTKHSYHMAGMAVDIVIGDNCPSINPVWVGGRILQIAHKLKLILLGAIGVYPARKFMHLDIRGGTFTTWTNIKGQYRFGVDFAEEITKGAWGG